jgi:hypothetical protein
MERIPTFLSEGGIAEAAEAGRQHRVSHVRSRFPCGALIFVRLAAEALYSTVFNRIQPISCIRLRNPIRRRRDCSKSRAKKSAGARSGLCGLSPDADDENNGFTTPKKVRRL